MAEEWDDFGEWFEESGIDLKHKDFAKMCFDAGYRAGYPNGYVCHDHYIIEIEDDTK